MTELEVLQEISNKLTELNSVGQTLIYVIGVIIALLIVILFAKAWGRNT